VSAAGRVGGGAQSERRDDGDDGELLLLTLNTECVYICLSLSLKNKKVLLLWNAD
jgi:hypothetical protein